MSVLLGNGDGTFQSGLTTTSDGPTDMALADFDRDGNLDLATANGTEIVMFLGKGTGRFEPAVPISSARGSDAILSGDFNGDEKIDLATTNGNNVQIILQR